MYQILIHFINLIHIILDLEGARQNNLFSRTQTIILKKNKLSQIEFHFSKNPKLNFIF